MEEEIWRPIPLHAILRESRAIHGPDHPSAYEASSLGRIRLGQQIVEPRADGSIHLAGRSARVNRMVCWAFHGPPPDGHQVGWRGDPTSGSAANLQWVAREPIAGSSRQRSVEQLDLDGHFLARHASLAGAARTIGCSVPSLWGAIRSGTVCRGFRWRYSGETTVVNRPATRADDPRHRAVIFTRGGVETRYDSVGACAQATGLSRKTLWGVLSSRLADYRSRRPRGWWCRYADEPPAQANRAVARRRAPAKATEVMPKPAVVAPVPVAVFRM